MSDPHPTGTIEVGAADAELDEYADEDVAEVAAAEPAAVESESVSHAVIVIPAVAATASRHINSRKRRTRRR
ncbi:MULTISPECIES: hypothetical protein [unclassified Gordonia (in: high G+C Gram-positive bacteria)]